VLAPQWERQRYLLRPRVQQADAKYQDILKHATRAPTSAAQLRLESLGLLALAGTALLIVRRRRKKS